MQTLTRRFGIVFALIGVMFDVMRKGKQMADLEIKGILSVEKPTNNSRGAKPEPIPTTWVEKLFSRFSVMYGNKFMDMWRGIDINEVKACWAQELGAYKPSQIGEAVNALKGRTFPPTLPEFLELCEQAKPEVKVAAHLPYKPNEKPDPNDPEIVAARERCMANVKRGFDRPSPAWAYRAKRRWLNNEIKYNPDVLAMINGAIERDAGRNDPFKAAA